MVSITQKCLTILNGKYHSECLTILNGKYHSECLTIEERSNNNEEKDPEVIDNKLIEVKKLKKK